MKLVTLIRIALTVALLVTVWWHSHWSVALCLTLLVTATEISSINRPSSWRSGVETKP